MRFYNSVNGLLGHLLEHFALLERPDIRVRILDLVLPMEEVSDDIKVRLVEGLIEVANLETDPHAVMERLEQLETIQRRNVLEKFIEKLISRQLFDTVLSRLIEGETEMVGSSGV